MYDLEADKKRTRKVTSTTWLVKQEEHILKLLIVLFEQGFPTSSTTCSSIPTVIIEMVARKISRRDKKERSSNREIR